MGNEHWVETTIGEVCQSINKVSRKEKEADGTLRYIDIGCIDNQKNKIISWKEYLWKNAPSRAQQTLAPGDILFSTVRTYLKNIALLELKDEVETVGSSGFSVLRPSPNFVVPHFLFHFVLSVEFLNRISTKQTGSSYPAVRDSDVREELLPLPPLPEQRAIVDKIEAKFSALDKAEEELTLARQRLKQYRQSVLQQAFEGKLTAAWRKEQRGLPTADELRGQIRAERLAHHNSQMDAWKQTVKEWEAGGKLGKKPRKPGKLKELPPLGAEEIAELPGLPEGWGWERVGNIAMELFDGPFGSNLKSSDYTDSGVRVVRLENIGVRKFELEKKTYISREKYFSLERHTIFPGDLVFSSFIAGHTRVAQFPASIPYAINKADCFCIRTGNPILQQYLLYFLSTRNVFKQLANEVHGATRPRINTSQLKEVSLPLCSLPEQEKIVEEIEYRLSLAEALETTIAEALVKSQALRQSILKQAFAGELLTEAELAATRKEPDWEPAAVLLQRIQAEKAAAASTPKKRKRKP